ncbi:MAG: nucleoside deaminase [Verrucomicrobiae bacterium]|nr:nucleoside deaminase [Verrucomicrobiae bacterium]
MIPEQMLAHLRDANTIALDVLRQGHMPFGALLVAPDNETILLRHGNVDTVRHAESELAREAAARFEPDYLWSCTLVTTIEPCAMCAGTQYWANIGRLVYGVSEAELKNLTGNHPDNPTMSLPCREVFAAGQKAVEIFGPFDEVREIILKPHKTCWD